MGRKGILNNIKKHGLVGTYKIYKRRKTVREHVVDVQRRFLAMEKDKAEKNPREYGEYEEKLNDPRVFKQYLKEMHDRVITEELPGIYAEYSKKPVENKIIILETGPVSPSSSSQHIGKVLEAQGKYKVIYMATQVRFATYITAYNNIREYIKEMATAKAVLISAADDYLSHIEVRPETKIIQLWHGVGMYKKVGYSTLGSRNFGPSEKYRERFNQYRNYDYVTIAGKEQSWMFEDAMRIEKDSGIIVPVGVSRTDLLFDPDYHKESMDMLVSRHPEVKGKKLILYAPTFRGAVDDPKAPKALDVRKMANSLSGEYVLLVKHHGLCAKDRPDIPAELKNKFAFDMNEEGNIDIDRLLAIADVCITDYSSIAFEYAILERPIAFFAFDLDNYLDERGMYMKYDEVTPGPICKTNKELIEFIKNLPESFNKEEVAAFRKKYVDMCDGHATERTIALIET